jgi:SAM-dependent methyltransferase
MMDITERTAEDYSTCWWNPKAIVEASPGGGPGAWERKNTLTQMNLGSGKNYRDGWLNVDTNPQWEPDLCHDLSQFIHPSLNWGSFDLIVANDVLEHVPNLVGLMTNLMLLLRNGGELHASVPYDLSFGAWQDPTHVRAFNERSWLYYTDWFWYLNWRDHRYDLVQLDYLYSDMGKALLAGGHTERQVSTTPRMVDQMNVVLRKRETTDAEKATHAFHSSRSKV